MGKILDAIRRKRSAGSTTPTSMADSSAASILNAETDKENSSYVGNRSSNERPRVREALQLGNREVIVGEDVEACIEVTLSNSTEKGSFETVDASDSVLVAIGSSSESTIKSYAGRSEDELTQISDDGVLRDDEGNPIGQDEAEENMLRDDEGNVIDPKSLVVRDYLLDLSCESDEYYDDSGEHIDPKELISCIGAGDPRLPIVTDSSTHSEGEGEDDFDLEYELRHEHPIAEEQNELRVSNPNKYFNGENIKEPLPPSSCRVQPDINYENNELKARKGTSSSRRRRRRRSSSSAAMPAASDSECVHIMFNNRLSTLQEEQSLCSPQHTNDSGDEADDESPAPEPREKQPSSKVTGIGSFDEKFIKARWEYSLQMMSCGGSTAIGAVIDVSYIIYCQLQLEIEMRLI
eukprot:scaffold116356_cov122-Cyclotella_meneghiniana.AAC.1